MQKTRIYFRSLSLVLCLVYLAFFVLPLLAQDVPVETQEGQIDQKDLPLEGLSSESFSKKDMLFLFAYVADYVEKFYVDEVPYGQLMEGALKGLFHSLGDPYSQYLTSKELDDLSSTTVGEYGGIGIYHQKIAPESLTAESKQKDQYILVVAPIEDTPAYRAGLQAGDMITHIEKESVVPLSSDDVMKKLRGKPGTSVTISVLRGAGITFDVTLQRTSVTIPTVKSAMTPEGYGYLRLMQFTPHTAEDARKAVESFRENAYKGLIIDVRSNPGGLFQAAFEIADFFFTEGPIVSTGSRIPGGDVVFQATPQRLVDPDLPVIVLIDRGTASASEILVGALKDRKRATVLGGQSFGKGLVQNIIPLPGNSGFKLTMSRYFTPNGDNIDKKGIAPDELTEEAVEFTAEEEKGYERLFQENLIDQFLESRKQMKDPLTQVEIDTFMESLRKKNIVFRPEIVGRLLQFRYYQLAGVQAPVYDTLYDKTLQKALERIKQGA